MQYETKILTTKYQKPDIYGALVDARLLYGGV